jgi:predicted GNAT family N-acyltransferase
MGVSAIDYSTERPIEAEKLRDLTRQTNWAGARTLDGLEAMLAGTQIVVGAWKGDRLVGFARALTDGVYRALVDDVIVDEAERGQGVGDELVRRLLERLAEVEAVSLRCDEALVPFYTRHGFRRGRAVAMDRPRNEGERR